ncbi:uncharacterized protein LOC133721605 isoform X2 [Rosa rugosa]|uniref:uncharacterized protein LOC133721605 isoform X2 n=1 Tax=Rosa rugosa TaxID=74645 RepID=UPI002B406E36|nr:uncharacterized protein LOC133721605 isoform X2 [Rosa rugosa]
MEEMKSKTPFQAVKSRFTDRKKEKEMKAIVREDPGGPEVLRVMRVPEPKITDDEVLIRVAATALNGPDIIERRVTYPPSKTQSPILGLECAGTIEKVGQNVKRWQVGQQVCAVTNGGAYAEKVAVPQGLVLPIPEGIPLAEAASFPQVACSVWAALFTEDKLSVSYFLPEDASKTSLSAGGSLLMASTFWAALTMKTREASRSPLCAGDSLLVVACTVWVILVLKVKLCSWFPGSRRRLNAGETLMVHGGSGGIGTFTIQLAKQRGVKVIATAVSDDQLRACEELGADECIAFNHKDKDKNKAEKLIEMVKSKTYGKVAGFRYRNTQYKARIVREVEEHVWPLIAAGGVKPVVHHRFPFSEATEAHRLMESGEHVGKILLIPDN